MIRILSAEQIREADRFTIEHEPIKSIDLMERAAKSFLEAISFLRPHSTGYFIFCGSGNNGGDGLAIARLLIENNELVKVYILKSGSTSPDFLKNKRRLLKLKRQQVYYIKSEKDFPNIASRGENEEFREQPIIIDALFGTGLNRPLEGVAEALVNHLNQQHCIRIAVDIPSGLNADHTSTGASIHANHTITFQSPKQSFLFAETFESVGELRVTDIGLDKNFIATARTKNFILESDDVSKRIHPRKKFSHKGTYGHALIHAGSKGKMGAAILCTKACTRSGAGLTTLLTSKNYSHVINIAAPDVMTEEQPSRIDTSKYSAFAFGPGIGTGNKARETFFSLLKKISKPCVLDADALNLLSRKKNWWKLIPKNSILTPHPKEFERLVGKTSNWEERHNLQLEFSAKHSLYIVLKGANTCITTPNGNSFFNSTGNPGMAKGGSGDVLTGMLVALLAQKYSAEDACINGVYLHGLAADLAVKNESPESLLATDIINSIGDAFNETAHPSPS